ncbi:MAG: copper chaperone PCu(A)C [Mariprofundaceae bacterium]|nr:copper chaperone PCu(A)C [Mariprofundaceae bacterium]
MIRKYLWLAALLLMPVAVRAEVIAEEAWIRLPPPAARTAAGYFILRNTGDMTLELVGAQCDVADRAVFHAMYLNKGMPHMRLIPRIVLPPHRDVPLYPGGTHLMLIGLHQPLTVEQDIPIHLHFAGGITINIIARVKDVRDYKEGGDAQHRQ